MVIFLTNDIGLTYDVHSSGRIYVNVKDKQLNLKWNWNQVGSIKVLSSNEKHYSRNKQYFFRISENDLLVLIRLKDGYETYQDLDSTNPQADSMHSNRGKSGMLWNSLAMVNQQKKKKSPQMLSAVC